MDPAHTWPGEEISASVRAERQRLANEASHPPSIGAFLWPAIVALMGIGIGVTFTLTFQKIDGGDSTVTDTPDTCTIEAAPVGGAS